MSLASAAKDDESEPDMAIEMKPMKLDPLEAMSHFVKAVKASDVAGAYDAFCLLHEAHKDEQEESDEDE